MIKVLIIDDSELIRELLSNILSQDEHINVVGTAVDPFDARSKIKSLNPDVITLDIEMPRMDGITFLKNLIRLRPMPVVMISTLTEKGADITLQALQVGAVDFISKPRLDVSENLAKMTADIRAKVKSAAKANVANMMKQLPQSCPSALHTFPEAEQAKRVDLIAIGASTGGTEAIKNVLLSLPSNMPPILIVQHMPPGFTLSFANRLNTMLSMQVSEFNEKQTEIKTGHVYIANGASHMTIKKKAGKFVLLQDNSEAVNRHKPSVDKLFDSIAQSGAEHTLAVILTGMGADGAAGLKNMNLAGATTIAQDQNSCVVWGMPRIAIEHGGVTDILPLEKIGQRLVSLCHHPVTPNTKRASKLC